jgi:hypothetical protein
MHRRFPHAAVVASCALGLAACSGPREGPAGDTAAPATASADAAAADTTDTQEVRRALDEYLAGYFRGDTAVLARYEADDFTILSAGRLEDAAGRYVRIDSARRTNRWFPQPVALALRDVTARRYGGTATAVGRSAAKVRGKGCLRKVCPLGRHGHRAPLLRRARRLDAGREHALGREPSARVLGGDGRTPGGVGWVRVLGAPLGAGGVSERAVGHGAGGRGGDGGRRARAERPGAG